MLDACQYNIVHIKEKEKYFKNLSHTHVKKKKKINNFLLDGIYLYIYISYFYLDNEGSPNQECLNIFFKVRNILQIPRIINS